MQFTRKLHPAIRNGEITCSVRIWKQPRARVGGRHELARRSGFEDVADLMKTARHGSGEHVFLVEFHYEEEA